MKGRMKLIYIMQEFSSDVGGWGMHLFQELSKSIDVTVLAKPYGHSIKKAQKVEIINPHFKVIRYSGPEIRGTIFPTDLKSILAIEKTPICLLQMDEFFKIYTIQAAEWCKQNNIPYIISSRMRLRPGRIRGLVIKLFANRAKEAVEGARKIIATQGKISQDEFMRWFPLKKESDFTIIPSGLNINQFTASINNTSEKKRNVILAVSRIYPIKRLDLTLQILAKLNDKNVNLWVIGKENKKELAKLENMITTLGLQGRVRFFGGLENKELPKFYVHAKLLVNTSETEGICFSFLEAMACKLPIVAWDVGGNSGVIEDGVTGYLTEFGNTDKMANFINYLLDHEEERKNMGEKAYSRLCKEFDIQKNAQRLLEIYKEILK